LPDANPTLARLDDQIAWYDRKSGWNQQCLKVLKVTEMVIAGAIPVSAAFDPPAWLAPVLGASVVMLEGVLGLFQFSALWTSYRATAEALKHEKYLFAAGAGPYRAVKDPVVTLAERVESLVSQEHAKWVRGRQVEEEPAAGSGPGGSPPRP
jgi:hypothetical protein